MSESAADRWLEPRVFGPLLVALAAGVSAWVALVGLPSNDEGALLTAAARLLRGGIFYRDVDSYPFPAAAYLLAFAMRVFGEHLTVARVLAGALYCVSVVSLYAAAVHLMDHRRAALFGLCLLAFKFLAWPAFTHYMYADLSFAFACAAIALLVGRPPDAARGRLVAAGACLGISIAAKQNLGIPLTLVSLAWLAWPEAWLRAPRSASRGGDLGALAGGWALVWLPILAYFGAHGLLPAMLTSGLVAPFTGYLPTSSVAFLQPLRWWELGSLQGQEAFPYSVGLLWSMLVREELPWPASYPAWWMLGEIFARALYTSLPVIFGFAGWLWLQLLRGRRSGVSDRTCVAFGALAFAVAVSAFPRADFYHVIGIYPVVVLLVFALRARAAGESERVPGWRSAVAVVAALALFAALTAIRNAQATFEIELAKAHFRVSHDETFVEPVVRYILEETEPGDGLLVYGHEAYYYFLSDRYSPWRFSQLYPGQAGGDGGAALVASLEREPPRIVVSGMLSWAGVPPVPAYTPVLVEYLRSHYQLDPSLFRRFPPQGSAPPPAWMLSVLEPRVQP